MPLKNNYDSSNREKILLTIGTILLFCCFVFVGKQLFINVSYNVYSPKLLMVDKIHLNKATRVEQSLTKSPQMKNINAISLLFVVNEKIHSVKQGKVIVSILEDEKVVQSWNQDTRFLRNNVYSTYKLDNTLVLGQHKKYSIIIEQKVAGNNDVGVAVARAGKDSFIKIGEKEKKDSFSLCYRTISPRKSNLFSTTMSILFSIFGLVLIVLFKELKVLLRTENGEYEGFVKLVFLAFTMILIVPVLLVHGDGIAITTQVLKLLEAVQTGNYRDYATICGDTIRIMPNYNIFVNIFNALLLAPLYFIRIIFDIEINIQAFNYWRCLCSGIFVFITSKYLEKIALAITYDKVFSKLFGILYLVSPAILWGNLGMGQVDCFVTLFMVIAFYKIVQENYVESFFWIGLASVVKEFAILFAFLPWFFLVAGNKNVKRTYKCVMAYSIMPIFTSILSHFVFIQYAALQTIAAASWGHLSRIFRTNWENTSCFLLALFFVCLICLFKSFTRRIEVSDFVISSLLIITSFHIFVQVSLNWEVYILLAMMAGLLFTNRIGLLALFVSQCGLYLYALLGNTIHVGSALLRLGIIGKIFNLPNFLVLQDYAMKFLPDYAGFLGSTGKTLISASLIFFVYLMIEKHRGETVVINNWSTMKPFVMVICSFMAMNMLAIFISFIVYFAIVPI